MAWPQLDYASWRDTGDTLHRWMQVVGKVRLALAPRLNHFWQATFYLTARGATSGLVPLPGGAGAFSMGFDFLADELIVATTPGPTARLPLRAQSVADFQRDFLALLDGLGIAVKIWPVPVEMSDTLRFDTDHQHASYDGEVVRRWWRALIEAERVFEAFRAGYVGKCSPVHLFWGSLDLAVTRFSGRRAPEREGADAVTREAYSHEVASVGFWPGDANFPHAAFYAYAAPAPQGFAEASVQPATAFYSQAMGEFLLKYEDVRRAADPAAELLAFCQSSYEAAASLGHWDRAALELPPTR